MSTEVPTPTKRALTPSYTPEKGLHQTWPGFGFKSVSKEGARVLRHRIIKIDPEEAPSMTTPMTASRSKVSRAKANWRQNSAKKYANIVSLERSEEGRIDKQTSKKTWKNRLPSRPDSLLTRQQAASAKAIDNCSSAVGDGYTDNGVSFPTTPSNDGHIFKTTAVQGPSQLGPLVLDREAAKCLKSVRGVVLRSHYP